MVRVHPELQKQFRIVLVVLGLLFLLTFSGLGEEVVLVLWVGAAFAFLLLAIVQGFPAQYEIAPEQRPQPSNAMSKTGEFEHAESKPVSSTASSELRRALGDRLATELHDLEKELLEQAANGRFPSNEVALLAQELAKNRTELIGDQAAAADGTPTGQPQSDQPGN